MTCCDEHATIKTSKLGTQFFAHKRRGECTSAAETAEHLFVKACIAKAIRGTGWEVNTEQRGQAPDGSVWVADVMASRGAHRIPDDLPEHGRQYDAQRLGGVAVELISHLPIERQARVIGATWLDQQLIGGGSGLGNLGFGGEAKQAMLQRADFLAEQGLAERRGQRVFLARNLLTVMRNREVAQAGKDIAAETGLEHRPAADGQRVAGIYRRSVMLASGRYAMLDSRSPRRCAAVGCHGKLDGGLGCPEVSQADASDPTEWIQRALLEHQLGAINPGSRDADARSVRQVTRSAFR